MAEEEDVRQGETAGQRERRLIREGRLPREAGTAAGGGGTGGGATGVGNGVQQFGQGGPGNNYNYSTNLGAMANPNYQYQVGDVMQHPGPEPDRNKEPELWAEWKAHAAAWRRYIGQAQQYVNTMIAVGYSPEELGIFNRKEEGQAMYRRLTMDNNAEINRLREHGARWMRGSDAEVDPRTGFYVTGTGPGNRAYYDSRGMRVNAQGQRIGGFYGQGNVASQYGSRALSDVNATQGRSMDRPGNPNMNYTEPLPPAPGPTAYNPYASSNPRRAPSIRQRRNRQTPPPPPYGI